jgi:archaellum component FlaC
MNNIDDIQKLTERLSKDSMKLKKIMDHQLSNIPEDAMEKVAPIQADMNRILRSVKDGNVDAINEIRNKYADIH